MKITYFKYPNQGIEIDAGVAGKLRIADQDSGSLFIRILARQFQGEATGPVSEIDFPDRRELIFPHSLDNVRVI